MSGERTILVVEDSPTMRRFYEFALGRDGARRLLFADDGVAGLDLAAQHEEIELFIVDVNMPRMNGIDFIRKLRTELGVSSTPVLVVTTETDPGDRAIARDVGATDYLTKPLRPDQLIKAVERLEAEASS